MKELRMMTGGTPIDVDALSATQAHVRAGDVFFGAGSDEEQTGSLPDRTESTVTINSRPMHGPDDIRYGNDSDNILRIAVSPPRGDWPGGTGAYVGIAPDLLGIYANIIASGYSICGVNGEYGSDANVVAKNLKDGVIAYGRSGKVVGSAVDYGNVAVTLKCGESYTIREGIYGTGKVTAATLASQTGADSGYSNAGDAQILNGYQAWSNGVKRTGSMKNVSGDATVTRTSTNTTKVVVGDAAYQDTNSDNVKRVSIRYNGTAGYFAKGTLLGVALGTMASALGITAAKIQKGTEICGVTGTWYGNKKAISAFAIRGFGAASSDYETSDSASFTMPAAGIVYYGGAIADYNAAGAGVCRIYKNGSLIDNRDHNGSMVWRGTMFNKSFSAAAGDVIKVEATATAGTHFVSMIQAVIVY